ncbi:MAG TPA: CDP-glucose 4,6-dehydratase [Novosphingobium sp.]
MGLTDFWQGRRVFVTGHTGFKGAWLCLWLERLGARVSALALAPETSPSLYAVLSPWTGADHHCGDIRDPAGLAARLTRAEPEVVIHLAAQALVRRSYADPTDTYATNVMGTINLLEAVRQTPSVRTVLAVTSDKVYANDGRGRAFTEPDRLGGADPYSSSKACAELVCQSYAKSFLQEAGIVLATARAGNVIGGGDWAGDRLVPDFVRALDQGVPVQLRYPDATRPWQHVLEPLAGYLAYARALTEAGATGSMPLALNFGPAPQDFATVAELTEELGRGFGADRSWVRAAGEWQAEAPVLTLNSALAATALGWLPRLQRGQAIEWTAAWYRAHRDGADMREFSLRQIAAYEEAGA